MRLLTAACATAILSVSLLGCPRPLPQEEEWRAVDNAPATRSLLTEEQRAYADQVRLKARVNKMRAALISDEERACQTDADCSLTAFHCCNCATGGQMDAVRGDKVREVLQRRGVICEDYMCPQVISDHPSCAAERAVCQDGACRPDVPAAAKTPAGIGVEPIPDEEPKGE